MRLYFLYVLLLVAYLIAACPPPVLAQGIRSAPPATGYRHYVTASSPEQSVFSSQSFGYQLMVGERLGLGAHAGPAYRHSKAKAFAPLVWGYVWGMSAQVVGQHGGGGFLGGYARVDQVRAGFSYQGFRQNDALGILEALPEQRARFEQTLVEAGGLIRYVTDDSPWTIQVETGFAYGIRGMYTPSDIYPDYGSHVSIFASPLVPYNQANRHMGIRLRATLGFRLGGTG